MGWPAVECCRMRSSRPPARSPPCTPTLSKRAPAACLLHHGIVLARLQRLKPPHQRAPVEVVHLLRGRTTSTWEAMTLGEPAPALPHRSTTAGGSSRPRRQPLASPGCRTRRLAATWPWPCWRWGPRLLPWLPGGGTAGGRAGRGARQAAHSAAAGGGELTGAAVALPCSTRLDLDAQERSGSRGRKAGVHRPNPSLGVWQNPSPGTCDCWLADQEQVGWAGSAESMHEFSSCSQIFFPLPAGLLPPSQPSGSPSAPSAPSKVV